MRTFSKLGLLAAVVTASVACQPVSGTNAQATSFQTACSIESKPLSGARELIGIARGVEGETGHYRFTIKGGDGQNSTSTSQGGAFTVAANGEARTGTVRLPGNGVYDANLEVSIGGRTQSCSRQLGTRI